MTREEREKEIVKAAEKMLDGNPNYMSTRELAFVLGAHWADEHPRWISVDKGLPTNSDDVLVCDSYGCMRVSYYHKVLGKWSNCDTYFTPTHWMPLPSIEHLKD